MEKGANSQVFGGMTLFLFLLPSLNPNLLPLRQKIPYLHYEKKYTS